MNTSRFLPILLITSAFLFTNACSKDENKTAQGDQTPNIIKENQRPPELDIEELQVGDCLSLQSLIQTINDKQFDFPARQLTTNINSTWSSAVFVKGNFGVDNKNFSTFPSLKSAEQKDCETVSIQDNSGAVLTYNIQESSKERIHLVYSKHEGLEDVDDIYTEAAEEEPKLLELIVEVTSPKAIKLSYKATTLFPFCSTSRLYTYWKDSVIRWDSDRASLQKNETIDRNFFTKIEQILATQPAPENIVTPMSVSTSGRFAPGVITPADTHEAPPVSDEPTSEPEVETPPVAEETNPDSDLEAPPATEEVAEDSEAEESTEEESADEVADDATVPADPNSPLDPVLPEPPPVTEDGQYVLLSENQILTIEQKLAELKTVKRCDVVD